MSEKQEDKKKGDIPEHFLKQIMEDAEIKGKFEQIADASAHLNPFLELRGL